MNLRDLNYLVTLADTLNFHQAAEKCYISQPTLSTQIKKLEQTLDVQLLERSTRKVMLTEIGNAIVEKARVVLNESNSIIQLAKMHQDPFAGKINLGIIPTIAPYLLPELVNLSNKHLPQVSLILHEYVTQQLVSKLETGSLDAIIIATEEKNDLFTERLLYKESFELLLSSNHPLANKKQVTLKQIPEDMMLVLESEHCLSGQVSEFCHIANSSMLRFKATSLETLRYMVANNTGLTLMPALSVTGQFKPTKKQGLVSIPISQPKPFRTVKLVWRKQSAKSQILDLLSKVIQDKLTPTSI